MPSSFSTSFNSSDFRLQLDGDMVRQGLSPDQLIIVPDLAAYCASIGRPEWEDSPQRKGKVLHHLNPNQILIKQLLGANQNSDTFILWTSIYGFDRNAVLPFEDDLLFTRQLLHHEIAHILRRSLHLTEGMSARDIEIDCDCWAFAQLGHDIRPVQR